MYLDPIAATGRGNMKLPDGPYEVRDGVLRPKSDYCKANGCRRWRGDGKPACMRGCFAAQSAVRAETPTSEPAPPKPTEPTGCGWNWRALCDGCLRILPATPTPTEPPIVHGRNCKCAHKVMCEDAEEAERNAKRAVTPKPGEG